jgi:3-oxoacyl-[acyl-carrier protein] reductase
MHLKGKIAVVTGGARGIGNAICHTLAEHGADIIINDVADADDSSIFIKEIENKGVKAHYIKADISKTAEAKRMIDAVVESMGQVDILVNNAGITRDNLIMRMSEEQWDQVISVNLKGTFNCIQAVSRYMIRQRGGSIVNMSSVVGIAGNAGQANYSASKAAVIGLTKTTARELAGKGVRCNAIAPGFIDTDMTRRLPDEYKEKLKDMIPLGTFGTVEDVANLVVFLASDESNYITGEVIKIDGGLFA